MLFTFYKVYLENTLEENQEPFDTFLKWAQIILQDFNEIDRYLVNPENIFNYLHEIQKINSNHWSIEEHQTDFTKRYLKFWSQLNQYYTGFSNLLTSSGHGYQGLIYREAVEKASTTGIIMEIVIHMVFITSAFMLAHTEKTIHSYPHHHTLDKGDEEGEGGIVHDPHSL